jgi:sugar lactone lactonase YvrE
MPMLVGLSTACGGPEDGTDPEVPTPLDFEIVAAFDPAAGELPEGLALYGGDAYVGFAPASRVVRVTDEGDVSEYGTWPALDPEGGFLAGMVFNGAGDLFGALFSTTPGVASGIYVLRAGQPRAELFAQDPALVFPNDLELDDAGRMYVSDSAAGGIFTVEEDGAMAPWYAGPSLVGDPAACPPQQLDFPVGVNGITLRDGFVYGVNTDFGTVFRIEVAPDGSAGAFEILVGPDCELAGLDGLVIDDEGQLLIAVNKQDQMMRISPEGVVEILADGSILDNPASLKIDPSEAPPGLYVTNFGIITATQGGTPQVGLLRASLP